MAHWICKQCEKGFERAKAGKRKITFCSQACYHTWRKQNNVITGQFKEGDEPWNKGIKGIHLSPATEFKVGQESINKLPIGTTQIRQRKRKGKIRKRAWVKITDNGNIRDWKPRALVVWEKHYGLIPKGLVLHHIDRDPLNDTITNLAALSRAEHLIDHRPEFETKRKRFASMALKKRWREFRMKQFDSYYWNDN